MWSITQCVGWQIQSNRQPIDGQEWSFVFLPEWTALLSSHWHLFPFHSRQAFRSWPIYDILWSLTHRACMRTWFFIRSFTIFMWFSNRSHVITFMHCSSSRRRSLRGDVENVQSIYRRCPWIGFGHLCDDHG